MHSLENARSLLQPANQALAFISYGIAKPDPIGRPTSKTIDVRHTAGRVANQLTETRMGPRHERRQFLEERSEVRSLDFFLCFHIPHFRDFFSLFESNVQHGKGVEKMLTNTSKVVHLSAV